MQYNPANPLIVQGDRTILLEVDNPLHAEARDTIAPFAELEKSPEHIHTYRLTPLSLWNAAVTYRQKAGRAELQWYARVDNLTNRLAYSANSILTQTAFPRAPLPGRSVRVGVQVMF